MYPIIYRWMNEEPPTATRDPERLDLLPVWARPMALDWRGPRRYRDHASLRRRISRATAALRRRIDGLIDRSSMGSSPVRCGGDSVPRC